VFLWRNNFTGLENHVNFVVAIIWWIYPSLESVCVRSGLFYKVLMSIM
jgi:hypothetical protein